DDVGGQDPGDLVLRGRDAALDVRQGDVVDGGVERVHDRRQHDADGDRPLVRLPLIAAGKHGGSPYFFGPVSTLTLADRPAAAISGGVWSNSMRTGRRCTTFTQLPVAFCAGRIEKVEPAPGLKLATWPWSLWPPKASISISAGWPARILA